MAILAPEGASAVLSLGQHPVSKASSRRSQARAAALAATAATGEAPPRAGRRILPRPCTPGPLPDAVQGTRADFRAGRGGCDPRYTAEEEAMPPCTAGKEKEAMPRYTVEGEAMPRYTAGEEKDVMPQYRRGEGDAAAYNHRGGGYAAAYH